MCSIRWVTQKPPTTLIIAMVTATNPKTAVKVEWSAPAANNAPTIVMPEMALEPDIRGVCNVGGTLVINSTPRNTASTNKVTAINSSTFSALPKHS